MSDEKRCRSCAAVRPLENFWHNCREADGHSRYCKDCQRRQRRDTEYRRYGPFSDYADWLLFCGIFDNRCQRCGSTAPLDMDHIDPFGPKHDIRNIQPLCHPCNSGKGVHHATDYRPAAIRDAILRSPDDWRNLPGVPSGALRAVGAGR